MVVSGKNTMELIIAARDRTGAAFNKVRSKMTKLGFTSDKVTAAMKGVAKAGVLIGGAAVVAGIVGSTKAFIDFEDAMANVRKTTGFTKEQIGVLGKAINDLALKIPVAQTELAGIAAVAGQLGIKGTENILSFTETVAMMTTAFDMSAESVAIAMAKLGKIYAIPIEETSNLGSAINYLGNTTAASESQLLAFSMALGPTGQQLGFTATEVLSLGAVMVSFGMDASSAGTRLNRAFSMIGQNLEELAEFMGVTTEEFTQSFENMPMETFLEVIDKLSQVEGKLKKNTIASEIFGEIGSKGIKTIAEGSEELRANLVNSAKAYEDNTSLSEEFAAKTDTLKAKFTLLKNAITSLLIDVGGELAPTLNKIIEGFRNILPAFKELIFEIGSGFSEMFESITRQAGSALDPLIKKLKEAGDKISSGLNFKTLLDDIGVFIGAGLNPLIRGFTWLIDKLGPLWELIGKGSVLFHNLANALKTEEGRIDDIVDATNNLTKAKQDLFNINERLRGNVQSVSDALEEAGGWTIRLTALEMAAETKTLSLTRARIKATEAISKHGADSLIAANAIEDVKIAEEAATTATDNFNSALGTAAQAIIDEGVATEGLEKAQLDFISTTEEVIKGQENLVIAVADVEKELEEAKAAPFDLGEAFKDFGKLVARVFLVIPLKIAEAILSVQETVSGGLEKIGLGGFRKKLDADTEHMRERIASIRKSLITDIEEPLSEDIPDASEKMKEAVTSAEDAIIDKGEKVKEGIDEVTDALEDTKDAAKETGDTGEDAFEKVKITVDEVTGEVEVLTDNLGDTAEGFKENEEAAKTLLNLDWKVFSELEANLPNINSGIGDMKVAFTGLEIVLSENVEKLQNVKDAVEGIGNITAPFTEAGFMNGIKSIGAFANTLKDAGSAINTFGSLQEVSINGMIKFSLHVNDMVSALRILETQMEDLVPAFSEMDLLITNVADSFLYGGGKMDKFVDNFKSNIKSANDIMGNSEVPFKHFKGIVDKALDTKTITYWSSAMNADGVTVNEWKTVTVNSFSDVIHVMDEVKQSAKDFTYWRPDMHSLTSFFDQSGEQIQTWIKDVYGMEMPIKKIDEVMAMSNEKRFEWLDTFMDENAALEHSFSDTAYHLMKWAKDTYNASLTYEEAFEVMSMSAEDQAKWLDNLMHSNAALTFQMDKQTNALAAQTGQLSKITDALEPYLKFMRTLNEIAALSTLSTEELNSGLQAIEDTLINLGKVLSTFDFKSVMESLFGTKITEGDLMGEFTGGLTTGFTDTMLEYQTPLNTLMTYVLRLSEAINSLVVAFKALEDISDSVLADQTKLKEVFKAISDIMTNFSAEMSGTDGFGEKFAASMEVMIKSADPLMVYFKDNNAAVELFNSTLLTFKTTLSTVIDTMEMLKNISEMSAPSVDELAAGFDAAAKMVRDFNEALMGHVGAREGAWDMEKYFNSIFESIKKFSADWDMLSEGMGEAPETFGKMTSTITGIINNVIRLTEALGKMKDVSVITSTELAAGFDAAAKMVRDFNEALMGHVGAREGAWDMEKYFNSIFESIKKFSADWDALSTDMKDSFETFETASETILGMINNVLSLSAAFTTLGNSTMASSKDMERSMRNLDVFIARFTEALGTNLGSIVGELTALDTEWKKYSKDMETLMPSFESATSDIGSLLSTITSLNSAFKTLSETSVTTSTVFDKGFSALIKSVSNFAVSLSNNVGPLINSLQELRRVWIENENVLVPLMKDFEIITKNLKSVADNANAMTESFRNINKGWIMLEIGFERLVEFIKITIEAIKEFYTPEAAAEVSTFIKDIGLVIESFQELSTKIESALNDIKTKISTAVTNIETNIKSLENLNGTMFSSGQNLITSFINGMNSMQEALAIAAAGLAGTVENYLGVESPTEKGPLMNLEKWPKNLVRSFSEGIKTEMGGLNVSLGAMVAPAVVAGGGSGGGGNRTSVVFHVTQNIKDRADADYSNRELEKMLKRHVPE